MIEKLNFGSALAALILFAFPWLDIQCSQKTLATQSGFQVIYGGGTPAEEVSSKPKTDDDDTIGKAPLVGLALVAVIGALIVSCLALFKGGEGLVLFSGVFPAIALTLLLAQLMMGFPIENELKEAMNEENQTGESGGFAESTARMAMMNFGVETKPPFYLELAALALPTLLLLNGMIDRNRKPSGTP